MGVAIDDAATTQSMRLFDKDWLDLFQGGGAQLHVPSGCLQRVAAVVARGDQAAWLGRFQSTCGPRWTLLEREEWDAMVEHIRTSDHLETITGWHRSGEEAGFGRIRDIYAPPLQLNRVYCYQA
jgi:hypothetical protein